MTSTSFPSTINSLNRARQSLQLINANLNSSLDTLQRHTQDLPRMATVTQSTQFFDLVSESEIRAARFQITTELDPQVKELVNRAESGLTRLQNREQLLRTTIARREAAYADKESDAENQPDNLEANDYQRKLEKVRAQKLALVDELTKLENEVKQKQTLLKNLPKAF